ncbi:MAG: hypothetical protein E2O35_02605 [Proteobacteria bacterium]|nr:MAG: hypothetical protein E2O35_02605 [Pseudomonadota bacterium]
MWASRSKQLDNGRALRVTVDFNSSPASYAQVLGRWQNDADFRAFFIRLLADSPFPAFRWETPPITTATVNRAFEFVVLDSPDLARNADVDAFAEHFCAGVPSGIAEFSNLGEDAILVVPCPGVPLSAYSHLGAYMRLGPEPQQHRLWEMVGAAMQRRLGVAPVWLSTAGAGVAWLHMRLDDLPKYYGYALYRQAA